MKAPNGSGGLRESSSFVPFRKAEHKKNDYSLAKFQVTSMKKSKENIVPNQSLTAFAGCENLSDSLPA
jgi:hypothetical protein